MNWSQEALSQVNILFNNNHIRRCQNFYHNFVLLALTGIQIRQHRSGQVVLNENHVRSSNLMVIVTVLGRDWYDTIRFVNRHLYCKYFLI